MVNLDDKIFGTERPAKLGTEKRPAVVSVKTKKRMKEIEAIFKKNDWKYEIKLEPKKPENIAELEMLQSPTKPEVADKKVGRNDPCSCGSGKKYKKCCAQKE